MVRISEEERTAYHEAGHAFMAHYAGAKVVRVSIVPDEEPDEGGISRFGETLVKWPKSRHSPEERIHQGALIALSGPVAEMLYTGDPFHPGLVAEWAVDWQQAWALTRSMARSDQERLALLERFSRDLYRLLDAEPNWSIVADLADNLLAHEILDGVEVRGIIREWLKT